MPLHTDPPTHSTTQRLTRDEIIALGRAGEPWPFVPIAAQVLDAAPRDEGVRFLLAANLARLGLRSLCLDQLGVLGDEARTHPDVVTLTNAAGGLPDDAMAMDALIAQCKQNVAAINRESLLTGLDLDSALTQWCDRQTNRTATRATDGTIVRRDRNNHDPITWQGLLDTRSIADRFARDHLSDLSANPPAFVLEGLDPPWLFQTLDRALAMTPLGYSPRLIVIQSDIDEFFDGLALADLTEPLSRDRLVLIVGSDAPQRYEAWIRDRLHERIVGPCVQSPDLTTPCEPTIPQTMQSLAKAQHDELERLTERVARKYADRDASWWSDRFAAARAGTAPPLRVLIASCLYSTYVQHASADLANAMNRLGLNARVLIEANHSARLSGMDYLAALDDHEPDLFVLINYPRHTMPVDVVPDNLPFVAWVQDAMPHLFDPQVGRTQTNLDFLVGQMFQELFDRCEYSPKRAMSIPAVADETKFHPGPITPDQTDQLACTIACVTHQSEPPEAMFRRLRAEALDGAGPRLEAALDDLFDRVRTIAAAAGSTPHHRALTGAVAHTMETYGLGDDADNATRLLRHFALPLADRLMRHEALAWAASIAARRGWTLRLFGKGWDRHPTLNAYACGELPHGEDLRASYHAATVHLHISATSMTHQRVMECALSGGLPVCRLFHDALSTTRSLAQASAVRTATPSGTEQSGTRYDWTATPESLAYRAVCQRLGIAERDFLTVSPARMKSLARVGHLLPLEQDAAWLLGDLAETTFRDEPSLEALVERALARPAWRSNTIASIASRVRARLTPAAIAQRIVAMVGSSLAESADSKPNPVLTSATPEHAA